MGFFVSDDRKCTDKWLLTLAQFEVTDVSISNTPSDFLSSGDPQGGRCLSGVMCMFRIGAKGQMGKHHFLKLPHMASFFISFL